MKNYLGFLRGKFGKQITAELLGTFLLALTIEVIAFGKTNYSAALQGLYMPLVGGLTLALLVALFGGISGANFNPAVTAAMFVIRKISITQLVGYILAQIAGAFLAMKFAVLLLGSSELLTAEPTSYVWWGEGLGAFILVLGVTAVVIGNIKPAVAGWVIGLALTVGMTVSVLSSGGMLNPALALALGSTALPYLVAPFVGGILAALLYTWLSYDQTTAKS